MQEAIQRQYGALQQWVEWVGADAVDCLRNLEKNNKVSTWTLHDLREVLTPEMAKKLVPVMMQPGVRQNELDDAIHRLVLDMYVDWCWVEENPFIHPKRGMLPSCLLGCLDVLALTFTIQGYTSVFLLVKFMRVLA